MMEDAFYRGGEPLAAPPRSTRAVVRTAFAGPGEMRQRVRELDWAATPLGPIEGWPVALRVVVDVLLGSAFPQVVLWGPELIQIYNDAYRELIGRRHPAALGQSVNETWPSLREQSAPLYAQVLNGETISLKDAGYELERNGSTEMAYFTATQSPIRGDTGDVEGIIATLIETTSMVQTREMQSERERLLRELQVERSRLEEVNLQLERHTADLRASEQRLREQVTEQIHARMELEVAKQAVEDARVEAVTANQAKSAFLTTMSHELRTPLNAVAGYSDLLLLGVRGDLTPGQRADLERIKRSGQYLLGLINDVLNFAKLDGGQVEYWFEDVPLASLMGSLEELIRPQVDAKDLRFVLTPCGAEDFVRADSEKVRQVLLNLLANAVKFTDAGGEVTLSCECDDDRDVVRLAVRDTGRGIAEDQMSMVFDPFVQVDRHLTPMSQQGVGLGLAISRDLTLGMGGTLEARSELGVGSEFMLTLPRARKR